MSKEHDYSLTCKYDIGEVLGYGTFSKVYKGVHRASGKAVAVKKIIKNTINAKDRDNWKREMLVLKILKHPNIISLVEHVDLDHVVYLVLEHGGIELHRYLIDNKLSESEAQGIFRQIANGINHIHDKGYVHRDIKLENTLIDENNCVKIIDFGFARYDTGSSMYFVGSLEYLSPELILGMIYKLKPTDVWALGVILYLLLYDKYPFDGDNASDTQEGICTKEPEYSDTVSIKANDLIKLILVKDADARIEIGDVLKHEWLA